MRQRFWTRLTGILGGCALTVGVIATGMVVAPRAASADTGTHVCGTPESQGVLSGSFQEVLVEGVCAVPAGPAVVSRDLTVAPGGAIVAAFAGGHLTVRRDVRVLAGGTAILGCFASSFPCLDDPNQSSPTLNGPVSIGRDLIASATLGVLMHDGTVGRDVQESGGGGGVTCEPSGIFATFNSPVYSDYEDSSVGRDLSVTGMQSCWFGTLRVNVGRDLSYVGNTLADPDASEVHTNMVGKDISCSGNSPNVQYGDAFNGGPNQVQRNASGECGFNVLLPNPSPDGPLTPISVRASIPA